MKKLVLLTLIILTGSIFLHAQNIEGEWNGVLKVPGAELRVIINISKDASGYKSVLYSPDQSTKGLQIKSTTFSDSTLHIDGGSYGIKYDGHLHADVFAGKLKQSGLLFDLNLSRKIIKKTEIFRPQNPQPPYPYVSEEVNFLNPEEGNKLGGTLTLPNNVGKFPSIILISGSGPQNRDEEMFGHKPFLVLADYLTRLGFGVLRLDDRGIGQSNGDFNMSSTLEFASDVIAGIKYLKKRAEIDSLSIGLIGHSEGGLIAPLVASTAKETKFIILLASPGVPGDSLLLLQKQAIMNFTISNDVDINKSKDFYKGAFEIVKKSSGDPKLQDYLRKYLFNSISDLPKSEKAEMTDNEFISFVINQLSSKWMRFFIKYDPSIALKKVKCPVLALNGAKDVQVSPTENLNGIKNALEKSHNKNFTIMEIPKLNHLFQECETGSPSEYQKINQTFSPIALEIIKKWLKDHR